MKKYNIEIKWAVIFVLMQIVWMAMEKLLGLHDDHIDKYTTYTNFMAIPAIVIYVLALLDKRKNFYGGAMNYLQGFITGLIVTFIVTVLTPLTVFITYRFVTPDFLSNITDYMIESGAMTDEQARDYFTMKNLIIQGLTAAPVMGIITSAIVAIFTRRREKQG